MRFLLPLLLFIAPFGWSQSAPETALPDAVARAVPDSCEPSVAALSSYFRARLTTTDQLLRAFYVWTALAIDYDVENMYNPRPVDDPARLNRETLAGRKAVCQGYCELFHELCRSAGIESYRIQGYTKQNGQLMELSHMWILAIVDGKFRFYDPTWGSGYVADGRFIRKFINDWYMVPPEKMIRSHMPFDPVWQCLKMPWSFDDFNGNRPPARPAEPVFSFPDTIRAFRTMSSLDQNRSTLRRIERNGSANKNISDYCNVLRHNIRSEITNMENEQRGDMVKRFNEAVVHYNSASGLFNGYINYWNKQFIPAKPDDEIRRMLDTCHAEIVRCHAALATVVTDDPAMKQNIASFSRAVSEIGRRIEEQEEFLQNYFATPKSARPSLFRKK